MSRFQILSLIGGGIRGAFVVAYLRELEQRTGKAITDSFDLIAGTSTGGIVAAGLALGMTTDELFDFYTNHGAKIFSPREPYRAKGLMRILFPLAAAIFRRRTGGNLDAAFRARFCPFQLQEAFDIAFGDRTLKDVQKTRLIIPTVNLTDGEPHVFRSCHEPKAVHDQDIKISDVVIAATAAPTYFPHCQIQGKDYVDGGIWSNDPSMLGFAEAVRIQHLNEHETRSCAHRVDDVHLLSIGTGKAQYSLAPPGPDAGLLYWAPRVAEVMGTSQTQGIHLPLKFLLEERYEHVNFRMQERWPLDAIEHIPDLFATGRQRAEQTFRTIEEKFLDHHATPFTPYTTPDGEIELEEFGFR
ncbi:MAG: CBASS cGAMP-activated phospholipase [Planctomycetota bacterium]